jgi:hypothetical protein
MKDAADAKGIPMNKDESREIVYGMPYSEWQAKYQKDASPAQKAAFEKSKAGHRVVPSGVSTVDDAPRGLT